MRKQVFHFFLLLGFVVFGAKSDGIEYVDQECPEVAVTHKSMILHRPKDEVCTEALASVSVYDPNGDQLLFYRTSQKVATIYNHTEGNYNTYTQTGGILQPVAREFALLNRNTPSRRTCLQQDFGPPLGMLHGEVSSTDALDNVQLIEYTDLEKRELRAQQTLELNLPGTQGAQRLTLILWYPEEQGNGIFIFFTYVSGDNQPMRNCSDILSSNTMRRRELTSKPFTQTILETITQMENYNQIPVETLRRVQQLLE